MDDTVNIYPVGVVVNPYSYWLAATPDRKVYCPERNPPWSPGNKMPCSGKPE